MACQATSTAAAPFAFQRVVAVVRAANDAAARRRVLSALPPAAAAEAGRGDRLLVLAGDVARPRLGLSAAAYGRLVREATLVVHAAALVKHWPLRDLVPLLDANAGAAVRVASLAAHAAALRRRRQHANAQPAPALPRVVYVSTATCFHDDLENTHRCVRRLSDAPRALTAFGGYGAAKYLGELAFVAAARRCGFPLLVTRPCLLTWATTRADGGAPRVVATNTDDWFVRLVDSVVAMRVRPWLHPGDDVANRAPTTTPVDACAARIVARAFEFFATAVPAASGAPAGICAPVHAPFDDSQPPVRMGDLLAAAFPPSFAMAVPPFAFCAAARRVVPPPPFFPLLHMFSAGDAAAKSNAVSADPSSPAVPPHARPLVAAMRAYAGVDRR